MATALIRPEIWYAWKGPSLFVSNVRGECGTAQPLSGYYYREVRCLRTLRLTIDGEPPWLCEAASLAPDRLAFTLLHPELTTFGGGGSGQSGDEESVNRHGIPHRSLVLHASCGVRVRGLDVALTLTNHARRPLECDVAWLVDADVADIQEAHEDRRLQQADIERRCTGGGGVTFTYLHPQLPYRSRIQASGSGDWRCTDSTIAARLRLRPQESIAVTLTVDPADGELPVSSDEQQRREEHLAAWRREFARVTIRKNRVAEAIVTANVRDLASFPLLEGPPDEWLALQAGMPLYPAFFGRDSLTAGWQAASLDRGRSLEATLTRLGRLQSNRVDDWHDEEPGRIPYQVRRGPLAILDINPYRAYYADYASPLMFVISLGHLYAWTGEKRLLAKHWDAARRILDWARTFGDKDGDGYLEYRTRSTAGTKNQGWKDSGDAIAYDDGSPVPAPIATCELQGYWFAAQQLMAVMSLAMGARHDAAAHWRSAAALKARFNRDWWMEDEGCVALAMDPDKRLVRAVTSNAGHCIASGIVGVRHLPRLVDRLFAPDMFSGWGIRTLSSGHVSYNPLSYHLGSVWAVEQATIAFGLRRFGFDERALDLARALFDLATLYPDYRIPECLGGLERSRDGTPGAYPRANTPQLWNASAFPLLVHTMLGLQPLAPLEALFVDPALPAWLPEVIVENLRLAGARVTLRCWRDRTGRSHAELLDKRGTLRLIRQPPPESLSAGLRDRARAFFETLTH
jgi:glycogen debranching enzyme